MARANEPVVFTRLTIHFHVVNIVKRKGNTELRSRGAELAHMAKSLYEFFSIVGMGAKFIFTVTEESHD